MRPGALGRGGACHFQRSKARQHAEAGHQQPDLLLGGGGQQTGHQEQTRLADVYEEQRAYEERLRRRAGDVNPDPLADPETPTFAIALGPRVIAYLGDSDPLSAWFKLGLFTLVETLFIFIMVSN